MTSLTTLFKSDAELPRDDDKLLDLFRNRAELKKEFAALRKEKYDLQDRIKHHEGATARVQQKLEHLESLLLDPEWVHNVVVFYQLRRLGTHCCARLERFAEQLKQQREKRLNDKARAAWDKKRGRDADKVQHRLDKHRIDLQGHEDQLAAERHKLETMGSVEKMFHGKAQTKTVAGAETALGIAMAKEQKLLAELERIEQREPPAIVGLDIAAKRSINFLILSFVQQLFLQYREDDLALLAKEASEKSVGAVNYGAKRECDALLRNVMKRREEAEKSDDFADVLQKRAQMIAKDAHFRNEDDAVPVAASVATVYEMDGNGVVYKSDANLLGENYFKVAKVLSR